jgi:uncharacterized protein YjdB
MKRIFKSLTLFLFFFAFLLIPHKAFASTYDGDGTKLDASIYWYGKGNLCQKFIPGQSNPYFDSNKPTVLYIHGWQNNSTTKLYRESFNPSKMDPDYGEDVNSCDYWIDKGWNIGIFYWNQFSDESELKDAEAKIWTTSGPKGMRWRKSDGSYVTTNLPTVSAAQLFVDQYKSALSNYNGSEIRIVGHSLGGQMAINTTKIICDGIDKGNISSKLKPNRVALLDPFWSKDGKSYLNNRWTGEVCREYVTSLESKGIAFEQYKTSNINDLFIGDANEGMRKLTCFTEVDSSFIPFINQMNKHRYARDWYFYSMAFNPPKAENNSVFAGATAPSASAATLNVFSMMQPKYYWSEDIGDSTYTPSDDTFELTAW